MNNQVSAFLSAHNFVNHVDVLTVAQAILDDMKKGLRKEGADQDMIRTFCNPPATSAPGHGLYGRSAGPSDRRAAEARADAAHRPHLRPGAQHLLRWRLRLWRIARRPRLGQRQKPSL